MAAAGALFYPRVAYRSLAMRRSASVFFILAAITTMSATPARAEIEYPGAPNIVVVDGRRQELRLLDHRAVPRDGQRHRWLLRAEPVLPGVGQRHFDSASANLSTSAAWDCAASVRTPFARMLREVRGLPRLAIIPATQSLSRRRQLSDLRRRRTAKLGRPASLRPADTARNESREVRTNVLARLPCYYHAVVRAALRRRTSRQDHGLPGS